MCGISGIINYSHRPVLEDDIRLMMHKMKHRGPDDDGLFLEDNIGLGFVRLSILDLSSAGHQPMFSKDKRYVIVFNGEVYNYIELREELKAKYTFVSGTDTEVVLTAYQEWGEGCLDKFNGMFAFVIYDRKTKKLFGARDRFGIKPFYYYTDNERFVFASEIKSILPFRKKKQADDSVIYDYLLYNRTDHQENTFFKEIKKLQHGHFLNLFAGRVEIKRWYNIFDRVAENKPAHSAYQRLFNDSLKLRLRADVPIGVCLSGGLDSSTIVASLTKTFKLSNLNTFSAVYGKEEPSDESKYIDLFRSTVPNMHFTTPTAETFYNDYSHFIEAHNEPVPDIGPYAQYKVMELASKHVKVTLDGQGADEVLAGYDYFFGSYYLELFRKLKWLRLLYENVYYAKNHHSTKALKYFIYYLLPQKNQVAISSKIFSSVHHDFIEANNEHSQINQILYNPKTLTESLFQHVEYKLEHLLRWEDLNAMHFSIESRVPFLDYRLVESTLALPPAQIIKKGMTKHILREAMKNILPRPIYARKDKKGFSNPRDKWFRTEKIQTLILDILNSDSFNQRGYFNKEEALKKYKMHLNGKIDISKEIWKWINLEIWFKDFFD